MRRILLVSTLLLISSSSAMADDRMDAYSACWSAVAVTEADLPFSGDHVSHLNRAVEQANMICNPLAKWAAKTNGKAVINEMWRYMEVQFYNANMRESG